MPRGRPPKAPGLHLVSGSYRDDRHGRGPPPPGQRLKAKDIPAYIRSDDRASKIWAAQLPQMPWLERIDRYSFGMWCHLEGQFEQDPHSMKAALISILRLLAGDLGITAAGRARLGFTMAPPADPDPYFDD